MREIEESNYAEICRFHLNRYRQFLLRAKPKREGYGLHLKLENELKKHDVEYIIAIETALQQLTHDEYTILCTLFVEDKGPKDLLGMYSSSTIYRIKPRAIRRFLHCLHN